MSRAPLFAIVFAACSSDPYTNVVSGHHSAGTTAGSSTSGGTTSGTTVPDSGGFTIVPHSPWPQVQIFGGLVLQSPTLVNVVASDDALAPQLLAFGQAVPQSQWWSALSAEYNLGTPTTATYEGPSLMGLDQSGVFDYLATAVDAGNIPPPNGNTIYIVYLPAESAVAGACTTYWGYHTSFPEGSQRGDNAAFIFHCPPGWQQYGSLNAQVDQMTSVTSHEIAEATTDPQYNSRPGWHLPEQGALPWEGSPWSQLNNSVVELGDLCGFEIERETIGDTSFLFQRIWSVDAAADGGDPCIPVSDAPFFDVTDNASDAFIPIDAGTVVSIPLTGWTTAPFAQWQVETQATVANSSPALSALATQIDTPLDSENLCYSSPWVAGGASATLTVQMPATATSGDWAVLELWSYQVPDTCLFAPGQDWSHLWVVGVYVP